jgi:dTDP-glucose 4,6-dehydratase
VFKPLPEDDPLQRQPDIKLAKELLNWEPQTKRREGLSKTIAYFKGLSPEELRHKEHRTFN